MPDQVFSVGAFIGLEFSHYRTNEEIGSGEMGVFFRAHDPPRPRGRHQGSFFRNANR